LKIASAARTRTDGGVVVSIIVFSSVVAAAAVPRWSPRDGLAECGPAGLPVGCLELGDLQPTQKRIGSDAGGLGGFLDVPLGEQGGNRLFLLAPEFLAMA
jgi:hypothetical protein